MLSSAPSRTRAGHASSPSLAVVVSGTYVEAGRANPVIHRSPASTWRLLLTGNHGRRSLFSCTAQPMVLDVVDFTQQWVFNASSQFARLRQCLLHIERRYPSKHDAFLRLRPDALVLGPLPQPLLPEPDALYGKIFYSSVSHVRLTRDQVDCGMCDQHCECLQRKYGQVLFHFARPGCHLLTDKVFLFGRTVLDRMLAVLANFSEPVYTHAMRAKFLPNACIDAGVMVETGFSRLLELHNVTVRPLGFRTVLERALQPTTPGWSSVACMFTWNHTRAPACNQPCGNASDWLSERGLPTYPWLREPAASRGCNAVSRNWYPSP